MDGYYYNDGARIYYTGERARVQVVSAAESELVDIMVGLVLKDKEADRVLSAEYVIEDILDAEVIDA